MPITSVGMIAYRRNPEKDNRIEYLMICRKDTLGYIDFMRGKYSINNKAYIMNMFKQMTQQEKINILLQPFEELWRNIWGNEFISNQYKFEEVISRQKFTSLKTGILNKDVFYNLDTLVEESNAYNQWDEPEWGFPKGRRNYQENDYECAIREFIEETGMVAKYIKTLHNVLPFEEIFCGSNYKSYKHKYFVCKISYVESKNIQGFEQSEVSNMDWKTYDECIESIRHYNLEKKKMLFQINTMLTIYPIFC